MNFKSVRRFGLVALASLGLAACGINSVPAAEENAKAKWADVEAQFQRDQPFARLGRSLPRTAQPGEFWSIHDSVRGH